MKLYRVLAFVLALVMMASALFACADAVTTTDGTADTTDATTTTTGGSTGSTDKPVTDGGENWMEGYLDEMPTFTINTEGNEPITSKEIYLTAGITVESSEEAYNMTDALIEIRGRGNYTWTGTEKKSYRIKFAEKVNLLGQGGGPARSWTLLAVHCDQSMLRTAAALTLAGHMPGIAYSSSVRFCRLILNGEYMGVFQVSEQMQVQDYRVNVDDTIQEGSEIGFLVELDQRANEVPIYDAWGTSYELKSDYYNDMQKRYVANYLSEAFEAVTYGDPEYIAELIDIDSMVDAYIVEELFKNLDVGYGSFYMHKDVGDDVLHFGPLWDFDLSAGNADPDDGDPNFSKPQGIYVGDADCYYYQSSKWFKTICEFDWFNELVKERWNSLKSVIDKVAPYVRDVAALYSDEFDENFVRWPIFGQRINREPSSVRALKSHDAHAEYVAKWLEQRIEWLDNYFNGRAVDGPGNTPQSYTFSGGNGTKTSPYLISTAKDFNDFTTALLLGENFTNKYFKQTADIDMRGYIGYAGVGKSATFGGRYDGCGYGITVELVGSDECIFPYVSGTVYNVVTYGSITNTEQAAGIARSVRRNGAIVNCISYITLTSDHQAAGIVASNEDNTSVVSGCFFGGKIVCDDRGGPINYYIDGRGGVFTHNYYLDTSTTFEGKNETKVSASEYASLADTFNQNLSKLDGVTSNMTLCEWKYQANKLVLISK